MEFELGNITVIYPNENNGIDRKLKLRPTGEFLHFDFIDSNNEYGSMSLEKDQVKLLVDTLNLILKNKLIEESTL